MTSVDRVSRILGEAETGLRVAYFAALLAAEAGLGPDDMIVVGGSALEIYTRGNYTSSDIDVVVDKEPLLPVLKAWGFRWSSRNMWFQEEWKVTVDFVDRLDQFHGSREHTEVIGTPYGSVRVEGIEDAFVKRLIASRYWEIPDDFNIAVAAAATHAGDIDWAYAETIAKLDGVSDLLTELRKRLQS